MLPRPLPPPQKGGGVWLRTRAGYGAAWRPHLLEKPRPLPHPQRGGGVEGGCSVFVGLCPTLGYVAPLGLAMVAQKKKEISKCLFLFLCYYNIIILQYYILLIYVLLILSMFSGYGCVVLYGVCERLSP